MSAVKYRVGDVVFVRRDLKHNNIYDGWNVTRDMADLAGQEVTIKSVENDSFYGENYQIDESPWGWTDEMFSGLAIKTVECERTDDEDITVDFKPNKIEELYSSILK